MYICTTYFANLGKLPADTVPISICGKAPDWYKGLQYKKLAPKWEFFQQWKRTHDNEYYIDHYWEEVLKPLNAQQIVKELIELAKCPHIALVCYEKPTDFCHRHLVAGWLEHNGISCREFKDENIEQTSKNDGPLVW